MKALITTILVFSCTGVAVRAAETNRRDESGFFVKRMDGKVFFMRSLTILEPGILVKVPQDLERRGICISKNRKIPNECPSQHVSFVLSRTGAVSSLADIRLEEESSWHRLNRVRKNFRLNESAKL